jgi:cytochrome c oxidase accessory protein FixG
MMDLPNRKAYLFSIEIWPEEAYYIAGILMMAAFALFFVTSLFGRIWCGYTCPHTVFVDFFIKVERFFQGDRNARIKLDSQRMTKAKFKKKFMTHLVWLLISFSFAFGWVCYFYDASTLVKDIVSFKVTAGGLTWLFGLTFSTYLFAGFARERVCTYMCPYGRFQSAMLDNNSYVVTYQNWRGEPRGKFNPDNNSSSGDCIDCNKCVVVCPMGIDIRDGLQMQCIGCGLCIDACDSVMSSLKKPLGLISYDSTNSSEDLKAGRKHKKRIIQPKTMIFAAVFATALSGLLYSLLTKDLLKISILHDRSALFTYLPDGFIRNNYQIKLYNKTSKEKRLSIKVENNTDMEIKLQGISEYTKEQFIILPPEEALDILLFIKADKKTTASDNRIILDVVDTETGEKYKVTTEFLRTNS